mmetsp:Transcript_149/g.465  ORF Transcript_149/g.465 Transcript_149/m.465 type:complete len:404 (-) Transcript_149:34-1245(-)
MATDFVLDDTAIGSATAAVHGDKFQAKRGKKRLFSTDADVAPPLSLSTTFYSGKESTGHVYSRYTNPTRSRCEALMGSIEGTVDVQAEAILYSSGLSACFAVLAWLLPAQIAIEGGYHGTHNVLKQLQRISGGMKCNAVALPKPSALSNSLSAGDVVWLETPRNPTCDVMDIVAYAAAAKAIGVKVVVDGTFAPPPLQRPLVHGADVVMHACTKSLAGHSDVLGGLLCVKDEAHAEELRAQRASLGSTPGQLEVWLLMRSLRTVHMRVARQATTADVLAKWLHAATLAKDESEHPLAKCVKKVYYPSLQAEEQDLVARQMTGGCGGCFALELPTEEAASSLSSTLELFSDATSLGGVESLIDYRRRYDATISPLLLRVSVGLEEPDHLKADLQQGILKVMKAA